MTGLGAQGTAQVVMAAHMPPPVTGLSAVNSRMKAELEQRGLLAICVPLSAENSKGLGKLSARISGLINALLALAKSRKVRSRTLYLPVDGGTGLLFNVVLTLFSNLLKYRVFFHHHSFAYINRYSCLMAALLVVSPRQSKHIFLCDNMGEKLRKRYGRLWSASDAKPFVLPNAFMAPPISDSSTPRRGSEVVLGHLSNLTVAKGVLTVVQVFEALISQGVSAKLVIAGPATESLIEERLTALLKKYPDQFEWLGRVDGNRKAHFFNSIDVFLFPTDYTNEAQPLVLLEALSFGKPILSIARGCIDCDHSSDTGLIAADRETFTRDGVIWLIDYASSQSKRMLFENAAIASARSAALASSARLDELLMLMADG